MGLFDAFKTKAKKRRIVVVHTLNPKSGYTKEDWEVDADIAANPMEVNGHLYVVVAYVAGQEKRTICNQSVWETVKHQFAAIEAESVNSPSLQFLKDSLKK